MRLKGSLVSVAATLLLALPVCSPAGTLEINWIDVGQGSSELIIGPNGTTILIDGGRSSKGASDLKPYLDEMFPPGSRTIDYVIASHDDSDHYGGLNYILDHGYSAGTVYHCGYNSSFGRGVAIPVGLEIDLGDGAVATCVLAAGHFVDGTTISTGNGNNASIAMLVEYGGFDYITAGDLQSGLEDDLAHMLVTYVNPPSDTYHPGETFLDPANGVDVLHVNHHGSRYSSSATYVNTLRCELAIVNGGTSYGHPHKDAIDRLLGRDIFTCSCCSSYGGATGVTAPPAVLYRTTAGGDDCRRAPEEDCPTGGDIVLEYDGGNSYSVEGTYLAATYMSIDEAGGAPPTPTPVPPTPTPTSVPGTPGRLTATSFEEPPSLDPIGYTLSPISGEVPDDPGVDAWGRWAISPRTGRYSFSARDCTNGGRCTFNSVDVSGRSGVVVHLWLSSDGNFEGGDYARAYLIVDGTSLPPFVNLTGDDLDYLPYREYRSSVSAGAKSVQLVYEVRDSANTEYIYLDDVEITADPLSTPTPTPFTFPLTVSFQPEISSAPPGCLKADGSPYGRRGAFGWR